MFFFMPEALVATQPPRVLNSMESGSWPVQKPLSFSWVESQDSRAAFDTGNRQLRVTSKTGQLDRGVFRGGCRKREGGWLAHARKSTFIFPHNIQISPITNRKI